MSRGFIRVNEERLMEVANKWSQLDPDTEASPPDWKIPNVLPIDHKAFVSHLFYQSAINFASTNFEPPHEKFRIGKFRGSEAIGHCFYRFFGEKPIRPEALLKLAEYHDFVAYCYLMNDFFKGDTPIPLLSLRRVYLKAAANALAKFQNDPMNILEMANFRVVGRNLFHKGLIQLLTDEFKIFSPEDGEVDVFGDDKYSYNVLFYKRAQLFALMYHCRAIHSNGELPPLKDPENIGPIIDPQVANALRYLGILEYAPELIAMIDNRKLIDRHSQEELEIRIGATYTVAKLLNRINEIRDEIGVRRWTMCNLDPRLWRLGRECPLQHHLTITTDY